MSKKDWEKMSKEDWEKKLGEILLKIVQFRRPIEEYNFDKYKYQQCLVSFIDLLGFAQLINTWPSPFIAKALHIFTLTNEDHGSQDERIKIIQFSDSIIRKCNTYHDPNDEFGIYSPLIKELKCLAAIQFNLACWYGLFLRGGITYGEIFSDFGMTFGPAIIEAYILESEEAIYPRILVHQSLINSLSQFPDLVTPGLEETKLQLKYCLLIDSEKKIFVDYLGLNIKGATLEFLLDHKTAIIDQYRKATNNRIREKYMWLKEYHNFSISSGGDFAEIGVEASNINQFLIDDEVMPNVQAKAIISFFKF